MKWAKTWTYVVLPAQTLLVGIAMAYVVGQMRNEGSFNWLTLLIIAVPAVGCALNIVTIIGLHRKTMWGWKANSANIVVSALGTVFIAYGKIVGEARQAGLPLGGMSFQSIVDQLKPLLIVLAIFWLVPNYLYWIKRKSIYAKGQ